LKVCFRCGETKPVDEFFRHPMMADGRLGKCKPCTRSDVKQNREGRAEQYQAYERERASLPHRVAGRKAYAKTPEGRASRCRAHRNYVDRYPEKQGARNAVSNAIRDGKLIRQPCEKCGDPRSQAHHDDYSQPLAVRWLCDFHHKEHHKGI
jgi:ribosomal protein S27AE